MPERSKDAVVIAMTLGQALQTIVSRNVDPLQSAVLSITQIHAGSAYNVIPGEAKLCGTVRAFSDEVRALIRERMRTICAGIPGAFQVEISADIRDTFSVLVHHEAPSKAISACAPEAPRATAKASSDRWHKGEPTGLLDGVPATIKDNMATKGVPVPLGAAPTKLVPAAAHAPPAARLREAGAVIFSKTTMPDYGMLSSGLSSFHPLTRNPWDLSKNPGGSSAGAAAAAAAGYGPLHLGTDIGGSVRLAAGRGGLVGPKPRPRRDPFHSPHC